MIIGREKEQQFINAFLNSKTSEFIGVYGRRRIGKTFLIRELAPKKTLFMEVVGKKDGDMSSQLYVFSKSFSLAFDETLDSTFTSWDQAFEAFTSQLKSRPKQKITLFLDELSWLATPKSGLLQSLDHFWNAHWSKLNNLKLVACGSAASWILENLINAKGGLHNRLTGTLHLKPLSLVETQQYLFAKGIKYNEKRTLDLFLVTGGVPLYLNQINKNLSLAENINQLCFSTDGLLYDEFRRLFRALFKSAEESLKITRIIASNRYGISRVKLIEKLGVASGGSIERRIEELEAAGFVKSFVPYGKHKRDQYYRVIDEYSFFYLKWIEPELQGGMSFTKGYWQSLCKSPSWNSWAGYSFEMVCLKHIEHIRCAAELSHVGCKSGSWRYVPKVHKNEGAQVDLLLDRLDEAITLFEIKYSSKKYVIEKAYAKKLANKQLIFEEQTQTKKEVFMGMITTCGIRPNIWSEDLVSVSVELKDLFKEV